MACRRLCPMAATQNTGGLGVARRWSLGQAIWFRARREEGKDFDDTELFCVRKLTSSQNTAPEADDSRRVAPMDQMCLATTNFPDIPGVYLKTVLNQGTSVPLAKLRPWGVLEVWFGDACVPRGMSLRWECPLPVFVPSLPARGPCPQILPPRSVSYLVSTILRTRCWNRHETAHLVDVSDNTYVLLLPGSLGQRSTASARREGDGE